MAIKEEHIRLIVIKCEKCGHKSIIEIENPKNLNIEIKFEKDAESDGKKVR